MKNVKNKKLALAVVALILAALTAVSMTYAWIDDVKLVEFDNYSLSDNRAPLKTGVDINSTVNITKDDNTINLGNLLKNSDLTVSTGEGQRTEVKHDLTNTEKANINEKKGYFYESGGMHLSPCYSDGETFYFERQSNQQSNQISYREGNKDDENVNYISYTVKVTSPDANVDFWFKSIPSIAVANSENLISNARIAITTDGISHVYSSTGLANTISNSAIVPVSGVRRFSSYTYNDESNKTVARGKNSNTLFSVKKGSTVILNIKIWLESGFDTSIKASDIDLQLVSSWAYTRKIWIDDKTTNGSGGTWVDDNGAKLYVTFPEFLHEKKENPSDWPNVTNGPFYEVQTQNSEYYVEVPLVYNNEKMILYRCNSTYWNSNASGAVQRSDYNVYCWNWWQTYTPNTYMDATYTLYGGSMDSTANGYFESINQGFTITNKGYGTWGAVEEIKVFSFYNNGDLATKNNGQAMYVVDHSDEDTSGEAYIYEMYRSGSTSSDPWKTYVPAGSAKIQFRYFGGTAGLSWGYNSWNGENPQRRPLASSGLYPNNATEYQLAAIFDSVNGWGYWRDTSGNEYDKVYLVKNGMFWDKNNVYDNLYDDSSHGNGSWPGHQMTRMKNASNQDVSWSDNSSPIFESDTARPGSTIYNHLRFSDGADGSTGFDNCTKTDVLKVFPGCFYNPGDSKWYGAIDDKGRDATETPQEPTGGGGSGGGTDIGGGSMDGFTTSTDFVFKINGKEYDVKTDGTTYKVRLSLTAGDNWTTVLKKKDNYPTYGNGQSGQYYETKTNLDLYLTTANRNNFSIRTASSGNFIAAFQYDNGNQNTIKITSILKED